MKDDKGILKRTSMYGIIAVFTPRIYQCEWIFYVHLNSVLIR
jgi:hypothetical protein